MSSRNPSISALLTHSRKSLASIERQYGASLQDQTVSETLRVEVKGLFENLRSVLDYFAHEIRDLFCPPRKPRDRIYFPILPDRTQFEKNMTRWFPDLQLSVPDLWDYLEAVQPYQPGQDWLGHFNVINNQNKHDRLIEQTRTTTREVKVSSDQGSKVSWNPDSAKFGDGVKVAGVPVDPLTQLPVPHPSQKVQQITWVDFRFEGIDVSAVDLMRSSVQGIEGIASTLHSIIDRQSTG